MSYFSDLWLESQEDYDDYEQDQLLERLEELKWYYEDLKEVGIGRRKRNYISDDTLRYVLPEEIGTMNGLDRAIYLAKKDLEEKYGLLILEGDDLEFDVAGTIRKAVQQNEKTDEKYEQQIEGQMTLYELCKGDQAIAA